MKLLISLIAILILKISIAQENPTRLYSKLELSYEIVEMYDDTVHIATIKTHTNFDLLEDNYFLYWNSGNERLYHFMYPESSGYEINRMSFTRTDISHVYKNDFKLFNDSIGIEINRMGIMLFNKHSRNLRFHN